MKAPKHLRKAALVARLHAKVACRRNDTLHKATSALVRRASAVVTEDMNVQGMARNRRLALSVADAGMGEALRQVAYKCQRAGKAHVKAGRFEPSTQRCSSCGTAKTGGAKLALSQHTFRCACGHAMDRDLNAALNLRRIGLEALGLAAPVIPIEDVGRVTPERAGSWPVYACGDSSAGRAASAPRRHGSRKQEGASRATLDAT